VAVGAADDREAALAVESLAGAVIAVDLDDRVVVWNAGAEELFGWRADEVLGRPVPTIPDAERNQRRVWLDQAIAGELVEATTRRLHRDGRMIDVVLQHAAVRDEEGRLVGTSVLCRDATTRLETYSQLERSQAELALVRGLVDAMPAGLAVVEDGLVRAWNAAAADLTGWSSEDVLGHAPPLDLEAAGEGGIEVRVGERDRFLEATPSELPGGAGRLYLIRDLTEQRDLERAKDLFFATTSHELKTPLTVVRGLAGTLRRHWDRMPEDRRIDALETIERRADSLDRLIERILVGSRVRAGALEVVPTPVALGRLVEEIVDGFAAAAAPDHLVVVDLPPSLPLVAGDRQLIDTILGHLLENAIKYSPDGGTVVVRAVHDEAAGRVRILVRDHGVGFEGDVEPLLHPFVQADSRTTRQFGGVGLGLYIVGQLVTALGGELTAANAEGGGAEFGVAIPVWE
jgi:PAS domain S-box-containing protein